MISRRLAVPLSLLLAAAAGVSAVVYAQLESGDRGILPVDSSGTLEITGIHVDVGGPRRAVGALCRLAHGAAPGLPRAVGEDAQCADHAGAEPAGRDARPDRQLDQRRAGADRARTATSPISACCSTAPARRRSSASRAARSSARRRCCSFRCSSPAAPRPASSFAMRGSGHGRSSAPRPARSIMSGSAASAPIRCWSTRPRRSGPAAAGGATCSISTAHRTCSSPRSSCSGSIRAGRRERGSLPCTGRTVRSSAASR